MEEKKKSENKTEKKTISYQEFLFIKKGVVSELNNIFGYQNNKPYKYFSHSIIMGNSNSSIEKTTLINKVNNPPGTKSIQVHHNHHHLCMSNPRRIGGQLKPNLPYDSG